MSYFRSIPELDRSEDFQRWVGREFPAGGIDGVSPRREELSRRSFIKLMAASATFGTALGCRREENRILPYSEKPEEIVRQAKAAKQTQLT